ncbi:hypothetical protein Cri9333_2362 [Crinalium epipsammum PCC 9333]|uniref:Uncharacterized protein n=1 Tax=Crinalium epipsammum PCC 9333 TaxID=1173022 RepID=K9W1B8_9CYAN|nr:hypothetical protein [Crinalium epipsammum]AFZ13230.1 hypothetical protein Cri9333_2362 [Crinalium epipsammum PCC 9333]
MNLGLNLNFSLFLLWLTYTLLGWSLAAHNIIWVVGLLISFIAFYLAKEANPLVLFLTKVFSKSWFVLLSFALLVSILVAAIAAFPMLLNIVVIPFISTFLVKIEMRSQGLSQLNKILIFTILSGLGLAIGEAIDIILLPSMRY